MKISSPGGGIAVELADVLASIDDLELVQVLDQMIREATVREVMRESGEDRKTVTDMIDAMGSMGQEAVLVLTEGEPTTLADALSRYLEELGRSDGMVPRSRVGDDLSALLAYPWPGRCKMPCGACDPETEASWRSRLAQEVYQHADRIEREPQTRSLGVALASVVRHVGDQIGKMPG
jgi:hypothetical protein